MTSRYIGGVTKKISYNDFKRNKFNIPAEVKSIEYDPNRSAFIALTEFEDGEKGILFAPSGLKIGQSVVSGKNATPEIGNALFYQIFHWGQ
ncbi:MAG: hypothetical protein CM15mP122_3520 [Bacteroidota bacterium]|nr:MAG: hypothetical protein CM15mP122_3520 [Bacteroidota bacterium]